MTLQRETSAPQLRLPRTVDRFEVTPEQAEDWLGRNRGNRNAKSAKITTYARDMRAGRWNYTGESIKFDVTGRLLDGQNRLLACIAAGVPFVTAVTYDLDPAAQLQMDTGAARTAGDALKINGYPNANNLASAIAVLVAWESGKITHAMSISGGSRTSLTHAEVIKYADDHQDLNDFIALGRSVGKELRLPASACIATVYRLHQIDADDAAEFFSRIVDHRSYGRGDPVVALGVRCRLLAEQGTTVPRGSTAIYLIVKAWNAFRAHEKLHSIILQRSGHWLTIPHPI